MTRIPIRWQPDDASARILTAYARSGERFGSVLRRALRLLAQADGVVDARGHVRQQQPGRRP